MTRGGREAMSVLPVDHLQSSSLDLNNAVALLESLCEYVATLREQFDIIRRERKGAEWML